MNPSTINSVPDVRPELNRSAVIRLALAYAAATNGLVLTPFLVSAIMSRLHLGEGAATEIAGLEILGVALSCAVLPRWISRAASTFTIAGVLGTIIAQALSMFAPTAATMSMARGMAGLFEGFLFVIVASGVSHRASADRVWGQINLFAGGINGSVLVAISLLPDASVSRGLFLLLVGLIAVMSPFILGIGAFASGGRRSCIGSSTVNPPKKLVFAIWVVTVLIYGTQASQWAVAGIVGERCGLSSSTIGILLSLSSLLGFAGAIIPSQRASHAHRLMIIWLAQLVMIVSIIEFFGSTGGRSYFLSQVTLNCAFFVVIPFLTGLLSEIDPDGSLVARTVVVTFAGAGIGTGVAGQFFNAYGGRQFALVLGICIAAALPFVWAALRGATRHTADNAAHQLTS
ncbi:MAG: MFS transporter [Paraburkholderia sp.]|uniref:MFS transporter n=1 Tax=Paraburkholderia sp. TaxID=1926495 RepID=UPI00397B9113